MSQRVHTPRPRGCPQRLRGDPLALADVLVASCGDLTAAGGPVDRARTEAWGRFRPPSRRPAVEQPATTVRPKTPARNRGGIAAEGVLLASVTDPDVLPADLGVGVMAHLADNPERFLVAILPGFVLLTVGPVLLAVALWLARSVPRWVPLTLAVTSVAAAVAPFGPIGSVVNGAFTAALVGIAWYLWRGARQSQAPRWAAPRRA